MIILITSIYFIAISGLPAHCQFGRFILLAQKKLLSFRAEISAAKLIFADPCKRFVLVRKLDFFHFKLDKTVLFQDAVAENPSLKDIGYVLGVQPFDCTPFYNASLDFADKTVKNFNFLFSGAIFMLDSFVNENLFNQSI